MQETLDNRKQEMEQTIKDGLNRIQTAQAVN